MQTAHRLSIFILTLTLISSSTKSYASEESDFSGTEISINPTYGFMFAESFQTEFGRVYLHQGPVYGVSMGIRMSSWNEYEVSWSHQVTLADADIYYYNRFNNIVDEYTSGDLAIDYFTVGMNGIKELSDRFSIYGGLHAGLVVFTPRNSNIAAIERFAVAMKGGLRVSITDNIGIRLQPQLFVPLQSIGADVFVGSGGSGVGISGYSTITQFGGSAGLSVTF